MANKGKAWLAKHDEYLEHNVVKYNEDLAETLGRSVLGIECRRAFLAKALHQRDPSISVEDCISRFGADADRVKRYMLRGSYVSDKSECKRKIGHDVAAGPALQKIKRLDVAEDSVIQAAAHCILRSAGSMDIAWDTPAFIPVMIKYHSGFKEYSSAVQARVSRV